MSPEPNDPDPLPSEIKRAISKNIEEKLTWRFLGLEVARKTEIIALAAFVMSLTGAVWQLQNYFKGAVVILFPSDQITFVSSCRLQRAYDNEPNLLKLIAIMAYVNEGETGQNATVREERIQISIGSKVYEQRWYQFVSSDIKTTKSTMDVDQKPPGLKTGTCPTTENNDFTYERISEARPFAVTAGGSTSHETLFTSWELICSDQKSTCDPRKNFLNWDKFISDIKKSRKITVTTIANIYSKSPVKASCDVTLRDWEVEYLEKSGWLAVACRS